MTDRGYSLQDLGDGYFRVSGVRVNPLTGRYITKGTTVNQPNSSDGLHEARAASLREVLDDPATFNWSEEDMFNAGWDACVRANFARLDEPLPEK